VDVEPSLEQLTTSLVLRAAQGLVELPALVLDELLGQVPDEERRILVKDLAGLVRQPERLRLEPLGSLLIEPPEADHPVQDVVAAQE
jgi:hypothetical protein